MKQFIKCPECGTIVIAELLFDGSQCSVCESYIHKDDFKPLPAISIKQPWAWLVVNGYKDLENRTTLKNFRGDVLIHASKKYDTNFPLFVSDRAYDLMPNEVHSLFVTKKMDTGGIVGVATFTDSVTKSESPWFVGPNAFSIENARPLPFTPCKGALGFFTPKIS